MAGQERAPNLVRIALVVEHERMNIAIAGVKYVRDAQTVFLARGLDEAHDLGQFRARHHAVLGKVIGAQPANRAERALAAFPQQRALVFRFGDAHVARAVLFAEADHLPGLSVEPRGKTVKFDD